VSSVNVEPTVSIAIVLHNSADVVAGCLESIHEEIERGFADLAVVDNGSPDDSAEIAAQIVPSAKIVRSDANLGFAGGVALAWPYVRSEYWLLLNPDVRVPPGGLSALIRWMNRHPSVGIASPELSAPDGTAGWPGRSFPSATLALVELLRLHRLMPVRLRGRLLRGPYWPGGDQFDAGWVPGAAMLARVAAVRDVGPPCTAFFMYGEDLEWCARIRRARWGVGVCAETVFVHGPGTSAARTWPERYRRLLVTRGWYQAIRHVRGTPRARCYRAVRMLALAMEAHNPRRGADWRTAARAEGRAWREVG
jgi:GT2 family glycosyltransferase